MNVSLSKNSDSTRFFSHIVGLESVSKEFANVDAIEIMKFASNPVLGENPKFVDLRFLIVNTAEKLNSVFALVTRAEGLTYHSDWLTSRHCIAEVTAYRVIEAKAYRNYI